MTGDKPYDPVMGGRAAVEKRWAAYRADRVARGLLPTKAEERGAKRDRFEAGSDEDVFWQERGVALGIIPVNAPSTKRRRIAYRLATAETAAIVEGNRHTPAQPAETSDVDVLLTYHRAEVARLTAARAADLRRADEHLRLATEHETAIADLLRGEGQA